MDLHQQVDETISDFKLRLLQNFSDHAIPEALQLQFFLQGINPNVKETVALSCPSTIEEAEKIAMIKSSFLKPPPIPSNNLPSNTIPATLLSSFEKLFAEQNQLIKDSILPHRSPPRNYSSNPSPPRHRYNNTAGIFTAKKLHC